ncbi:hypothetical protein OC846_006861, partial [Tilletia horrida]
MEKFATTSTTKRAPYAPKPTGATDAKPAMTGTGEPARSNTITSPATGANTTPLGGGDYTPPSGCYYCGNEEHNKYQCATFKEHRNKGWVTIDKGKIAYMDTNPVRGPRGTLHLVIQKQAQEGSLPGVPQAQTGTSLQSNVYELASEDGSTWDEEEAALAMLMGQIDNDDFDWEAYPARTADEALGPSPVPTKRRTTTNSRNAGESGGLPAQVRFKEPPAQPVSAPTTQGAPTPPPSVPNPTPSGQPPTSTNQQPVATPAPAATIQQAAPTTVPPQAPPAPPTTAGVAPAAPAALAAPAAPAVPVTPAAPEQIQATASPATEITPADAAMRDLEEEDELAEGPDLVDLDGTGRNFLSTKIPPTHKRLRTSRLRRESEPDKVAKTLLDQVVSLRFRDIIGVSPAVQKVVLDHLRNELVPIPSTGRPMPWLVTEGEHLVPNQAAVSTFASSESELGKLVVNQVLTQLSKDHEEEKPLYTAALPVTTVTIGGHSLKALLDTGSQLNTISDEVRQAHGLGLRVDYRHRIKGAGGHLTKLLGISENVEICFSGIPVKMHLWVAEKTSQSLLIGMPGLRGLNMTFRARTGFATIRNRTGRMLQLPVIRQDDPANSTTLDDYDPDPDEHEAHGMQVNDVVVVPTRPEILSATTRDHEVYTKAKKVADKIKPMAPVGKDWKPRVLIPPKYDRDPYDSPVNPNAPPYVPTGKMTLEKINSLRIDPKGQLTPAEWNMM